MKQSLISIVTFFIFSVSNVHAQSNQIHNSGAMYIGIGLSGGWPTSLEYDFAVGGDLRLQKYFDNTISGLLTMGYVNYTDNSRGLEDSGFIKNLGLIPIKLGLKVQTAEQLYFCAEAGAAFSAQQGLGTAFIYSPCIGIAFEEGFDLSIRYDGLSRESFNPGLIALRVAYNFKISKQ